MVNRNPAWNASLARRTSSHFFIPFLIALFSFAAGAEAADEKTAMTLSNFRSHLALKQEPAQPTGKFSSKQSEATVPSVNLQQAERAFFRLLSAQGRVAAARQSVDRLAGWLKSAETRLQAQSTPDTDVALLRLAKGRAAARLARFEMERLRAVLDANAVLKRPGNSPFTALYADTGKPASSDQRPLQNAPNAQSSSKEPDVSPDPSSRRVQYETVLLPSGNDLLGKTYQSYLFGGRTLTELLWQEQEVYRTDLEYRELLVELERQPGTGTAP